MKKNLAVFTGSVCMLAGMQMAQAATVSYDITTTFYEPDTQPRDTIFIGSFDFDDVNLTVSNLQGLLSESMTGNPTSSASDYEMNWLSLNNQLSSVYDPVLGGLLVTTFLNDTTNTFYGGTWTPEDGIASGAVYDGFPVASNNPGNAYAMIFVNTLDPTASLTQAQIDKLAYADCAPGGMMGATCMTGTTVDGYGAVGTMSGYPVSQVISPSAVPVPAAVWLFGSGLIGLFGVARRHKSV